MPTRKLILLALLVVVLGGCSIWYMKTILPTEAPLESSVQN